MVQKKDPRDRATPTTDWSTPAKRVEWLVMNKSNGNRTAFAKIVSVSHTTINKVTSGKPPGRKLLEAITRNFTDVNPTWLLTGQGQPLLDQTGAAEVGWLPVSTMLLPGSPQQYPELLSKGRVVRCNNLFLPGQYWLRLGPGEPILRDVSLGFVEDDLLLLETDRTRFPREDALLDDLCIIRCHAGEAPLKLAGVRYSPESEGEAAELHANTFDLDADEQGMVMAQVYYPLPGGLFRHKGVPHRRIPFRGGEHLVPVEDDDVESLAVKISYSDIVAIWTRILRRTDCYFVG